MSYDQYASYAPQQRSYYNQQPPPPRGASRGPPPPQQQRAMNSYGAPSQPGYTHDGYQHSSQPRVESYVGYDDGDILDQYGNDDGDHYDNRQQYAQVPTYSTPYRGGYQAQGGPRGPAARPGPQQYHETPQRRDNYGPPRQNYAGGPMGAPGGRGRGYPPSRGYPPPQRGGYRPQQEFGGMRRAQTAPQDYDDGRQHGPYDPRYDTSPPQQKPRERLLMNPTSPKNMPYDNPFPSFPSQQSQPVNEMNNVQHGMADLEITGGRTSQERRRPPTAGSGQSQSSGRPGAPRQGSDPRYADGVPRTSNDIYGPDPSFAAPSRSMTMPQSYDTPNNGQTMDANRPVERGMNGMGPFGGRGLQDPVPQRSFTSVGDMRGPAQAPPRPSTATGVRPQANPSYAPPLSQLNFGEVSSTFPQKPVPISYEGARGYQDQRPSTSQGYRQEAHLQQPPVTKEAQIDAYMPDFGSGSMESAALQDAIGLPVDGAPEAHKAPLNGQPAPQNLPYDMHKAKSQPNLRGQANGYPPTSYEEPMPNMPPLEAANLGGQRRALMPLVTDPMQMPRANFQQVASPNSPRQFHRPGAPPIVRAETAESGWSDPGPGRQGTPNSVRTGAFPQAVPNSVRTGALPTQPPNPDALPAHPTPVRPGLLNTRPGAADIRQQQGSRMSSEDYNQPQRPTSGPLTVEQLYKLREAVRSQPQNQAQQLQLAKKLVEAAVVLADENGAADARTAQRNRESYVNESYKIVKKLVANSYPEAVFYLADCYGTGDLGLSVDPKEAFVLYQSAAKLGHGPSAYRTAVCCEMGQENGGGTRKDPLKAVQWYRRGAALGDVPAMYKLGMILLKGHMGQAANLSEAIIWLERAAKAADVDNPHALHELAGIFETAPLTGNGVTRDDRYALELYIKAAKLGYRNSQARLGQIYEYGQLNCAIDNRTSIHWYSKAAAQEDHDAELALSGWYLTGSPGILEQNDQEAYLWARKAAMAENPKAEFAMGYFSETGIGCPKSFEDAKRWYGRAAAHRYPKAKERLDELLRGGSRNMKNKERISRSDPRKHEECTVM